MLVALVSTPVSQVNLGFLYKHLRSVLNNAWSMLKLWYLDFPQTCLNFHNLQPSLTQMPGHSCHIAGCTWSVSLHTCTVNTDTKIQKYTMIQIRIHTKKERNAQIKPLILLSHSWLHLVCVQAHFTRVGFMSLFSRICVKFELGKAFLIF